MISEIPCNWFQGQENSIDPVHFEWMHNNWSMRLKGQTGPYSAAHKEVGFDEFEYGFVYRRIRGDAQKDDRLWSVGRVCLWPNGVFLGDHFEWRVPIDDENTLSICWSFTRVPKEQEPYEQGAIPAWHGPTHDAEGNWITSHVMNQDFVAWIGQGAVADRSRENLGASDRGVVMIRNRFFDELETLAAGGEPKGLIRDPQVNQAVELPVVNRQALTEGLTSAELEAHPHLGQHFREYIFQAGQPEHVTSAYRRAMGLDKAGG